MTFQEGASVHLGAVGINRQNPQARRVGLEPGQKRQLADTGRAPSCPQVQQHIAALECIQRMPVTLTVGKGHRRGGFGGFFQHQHAQRQRRLDPLMDRKQAFPI